MTRVLALDLAQGRPNPNSKSVWSGGARRVSVACDGCGKIYVDYRKRVDKAKRHYCSATCQRDDRRGNLNPKWRGGVPRYKCEQCGANFARYIGSRNRGGDGRFCSTACKAESQRVSAEQKAKTKRESWRRYGVRERATRALHGHHTEREWKSLLKLARGRCKHCGKKRQLTRDHIIPLSKGGNDLISNIQPLCQPCNSAKHNRIGRCGYLL